MECEENIVIIEKIMGNVEDLQDIKAYHIEKVILESDALLKRVQRVKTDHGTELGISLPPNHVLKDGDIISVDCGAEINGFHGDAARTFAVGEISEEARRLITVTEESFFKGVEAAIVGNRLSDISHNIQKHVEANGFSVVRDFVGHGIGRTVHEDPEVPNFGRPGRGPKLVTGMALAIEPMVNIGTYKVKTAGDDWTVITADKSLSAHYENTVVILPDGPEILTLIK